MYYDLQTDENNGASDIYLFIYLFIYLYRVDS